MPCPASTKLMRRSTSGQDTSPDVGVSIQVVPYSATRVSLLISQSLDGSVAYLSYRVAAVIGRGMMLTSYSPVLKLTIGDDGELVRGPIYAISADGGNVISYWDSHLPDPIGE